MEALMDTLIARVDRLVEADKHPVLSTTPTSVAIAELLSRNDALEQALREIAQEVAQLASASRSRDMT